MYFKDRKSKKVKSTWEILMIGIGIIISIITGFTKEIFAVIGGYPPGTGGSIHTSPPHVPPVIHPVVLPPQFLNKWSVTEIIDSFQKNELEIANIKPVSEGDYNSLPAKPKEGMKFSVLSLGENVAGCVLSFENKDNLKKVKKHYQSLNKEGELYTWTFIKDNILLVLDGTLHENKAREFEKVLYDFDNKGNWKKEDFEKNFNN